MEETKVKLSKINNRIISCKLCPRLVKYIQDVSIRKRRAFRDWNYWGKPVPSFGDPQARLLIVGLAPAAHGANRTGRMFTGDRSGEWLYKTLYKFGFSNKPSSHSIDDELTLRDAYITAILHCAPPQNKPKAEEIRNCLRYLEWELATLPNLKVLLALGRIAFDGLIKVLKKRGTIEKRKRLKFSHCGVNKVLSHPKSLYLVSSYHPSQQNTLTGRLTEDMFHSVFQRIKEILDRDP